MRLPAEQTSSALPWVTPHARMRVALVLYGAIGNFKMPSFMAKVADMEGLDGGRVMLESARHSFERHVLAANPGVAFDAFAHSWSPSVGELIDSLWSPRWSLHEPRRRFARGVSMSAAFSMSQALAAKADAEAKANVT